jgi:hypothetical protein
MKNQGILFRGTQYAVFTFIFTFFAAGFLSAAPWESFETPKNKWVKADWGTKTTDVAVVKKNASEGKSALKVGFAGVSTKTESVASCESAKGDWSKYSALTFDVFVEAKGSLELTVAFSVGPKWEWFESKPLRVKAGWNKGLKINLGGQDFKSEASGWKNSVKIGNLKEMQRLSFKVMATNGEQTGAYYLDNLVLK